MSSGSPDWLQPVVGVNVSVEPGEPPVVNVEDSPVAQTWGWDKDDEVWRKILVNSDGKLIIDPSEIFEDNPTNNEHGKAPTSNWAYKHKYKANIHHTPPVASDFDHNDLSGIGANDHHTPPAAADFYHNDLSGIGASDHHAKTVLHSEITDFHTGVQDTLSCRGVLTEKAPQLDTNTKICEMVVFNEKLYGIAYPDGALFEWNGTNAWVEKAPKYGGIPGGYSLCVFNGKIYTGQINSGDLLEWNGSNAWIKKASGLGGGQTIFALVSYNGKLYAGIQGDGELWEWNGVDTWTSVASKYGSEDDIRKLIVFNGKLYGGGQPTGLLLEWNDSDAWVLKCIPGGIQNAIWSICEHNGKLYVGCDSTGRLWEWDGVDTFVLKASKYLGQSVIHSLISFEGGLYAGTYVDAYLLRWNGVDAWVLASECDGVDTALYSLCEFNSKLYCGTEAKAKLFRFDQPTLCEFQTSNVFHPYNIHDASLITSGVFDRDRIATSVQMPIFVDRGDVTSQDLELGDFIFDASDRVKDLSSIVPAGAKMILFNVAARSTAVNKQIFLFHPDYHNAYNAFHIRVQIANAVLRYCPIVQCNSDREIKYYGDSGCFDAFAMVIRGWWI